MRSRGKAMAAAVATLALAGGAVGIAYGGGADDDAAEQASGPGADRAKAAALKLIPGGEVNAVERDGEKGATWEVEVARPDGSTVDVRLDAQYEQVAIDADSEAPDDSE